MTMNILVLGGASYDDIIRVDDFFPAAAGTTFAKNYTQTPGSTGVGKALALAKLGFDVHFQANIGNDLYGDRIKSALDIDHLSTYYHIVQKTERHTNIMDQYGHRLSIYTITNDVTDFDPLAYEHLIEQADVVVLNIIDYCRHFIPLIQKHQKPIYCDLHDYDLGNPYHEDFLASAEVVFASSEKLADPKMFMETLIHDGKKAVILTHGENGASAMDESGLYVEQPADAIEMVDANGAGDNFFAGFVAAWWHGLDLRQSLLMGKLAANTCLESAKIVSDELSYSRLLKKMSETDKF